MVFRQIFDLDVPWTFLNMFYIISWRFRRFPGPKICYFDEIRLKLSRKSRKIRGFSKVQVTLTRKYLAAALCCKDSGRNHIQDHYFDAFEGI